MALVNPFRKMIMKGVDAGADGAARAVKLDGKNNDDSPLIYDYEYEVDGTAQIVKEEGNDFSIRLVPGIASSAAVGGNIDGGVSRGGHSDGMFNYRMKVVFRLNVTEQSAAAFVAMNPEE